MTKDQDMTEKRDVTRQQVKKQKTIKKPPYNNMQSATDSNEDMTNLPLSTAHPTSTQLPTSASHTNADNPQLAQEQDTNTLALVPVPATAKTTQEMVLQANPNAQKRKLQKADTPITKLPHSNSNYIRYPENRS